MVADWYQYLLFPIASVQYDSSAGMRKRRGIYKILYIQIEWIYFKNKRDIFLVSAMVTEVIYTVTTTEAAVTAGCMFVPQDLRAAASCRTRAKAVKQKVAGTLLPPQSTKHIIVSQALPMISPWSEIQKKTASSCIQLNLLSSYCQVLPYVFNKFW